MHNKEDQVLTYCHFGKIIKEVYRLFPMFLTWIGETNRLVDIYF